MKNRDRIGIIAIGILLIGFAYWLSIRPSPQPTTTPTVVETVKKTEVLIANRPLAVGAVLTPDKIAWAPLPDTFVDPSAIIRVNNADISIPYLGRLVIEPIRKDQILLPKQFAQNDSANYIAQSLQPGKRAFAVSIDSKGTSTAGNLILPNDYVDVIHSISTNSGFESDVILRNIRVLAIGQTIRGDSHTTTGDTATVEVRLEEAEILATAQKTGQISFALRHPDDPDEPVKSSTDLVIIRPMAGAEKPQ